MTLDYGSWGYRRNAVLSDYMPIDELIKTLTETISCGGNILINVGPRSDGMIAPIFEERLRQMGSWLSVNGEAIYASKPWSAQNDTLTKDVWYTSQVSGTTTTVYATILFWPTNGLLTLGAASATTTTTASLLGYSGALTWKVHPTGGIDIIIPDIPEDKMPCRWAWVIKLTNLK
jgi:alpha-L-fucosidase